jgi:hypothetical protein
VIGRPEPIAARLDTSFGNVDADQLVAVILEEARPSPESRCNLEHRPDGR